MKIKWQMLHVLAEKKLSLEVKWKKQCDASKYSGIL